MNKRVMVIDDEESIRFSLEEGLSDFGYKVNTSESLKKSDAIIKDFRPHVILLDMRLKDGNGVEYIENIKTIDEDIKVIIITAYGDIESAIHAMKAGAFEYITKPFDLDEIEFQIERAFDQIQLNQKIQIFEEKNRNEEVSIISKNEGMLELLKNVKNIAKQSNVTILITGETGTGKELMADFIHSNSPEKKVPMVKINCATIPDSLFESELFGHEKNAFTGAEKLKKGLIEIADGGTIFLDEIGEIPLNQQAKLLRFLEERKIKRVGGTKDVDVNVRVLAATNRNLLDMVNKGLFRADLYYRLNVVFINILPLRERKSDISVLAEYFIKHFNIKFNKNFLGFTNKAIEAMNEYSWPGNIRELRNIVERICIIQNDEWIDFVDLPIHSNNNLNEKNTYDFLFELEQNRPLDLPELLMDIEKECIEKSLEICNGNQSKAAEMLNISRFALKRKLDK
ncbi:sigma-54 dependent transcriptional regulator [Clostridiaceae bacterium HSG29]|nr:sigma-54 dependent transcriptional regulator [Clostridiaceae bacterium HSG29]